MGGALGGKLLIVFLAGVTQFKLHGLALFGDVFGGFVAQLGGVLVGRGGYRLGLIVGVLQDGGRLGVGVINNVLGVQFGVVDQRFGLRLRGLAGGGGVLLGAFEQFGTGLFRGGKHLLGVGAKGSKGVSGRLLVLFLLQLCLQLQDAIIRGGDLLAHVGQRLLGPVHTLLSGIEGRIDLFLVISSQHHRETIHHCCLSFRIACASWHLGTSSSTVAHERAGVPERWAIVTMRAKGVLFRRGVSAWRGAVRR